MKKFPFFFMVFLVCISCAYSSVAQQIKVGVFDIDLMVQAMPPYRQVDSLVQLYEKDSLAPEYQVYVEEYLRLDSVYKKDSVLYAEGKKSKKSLDYTAEQRGKMGANITYFQQVAQYKLNVKRSELAKPLYDQVAAAYKRILDKKKYNIVLKPQTYEFGFKIENIFMSVAKELKLRQLPQELLALGDDPDAAPALVPAKKN